MLYCRYIQHKPEICEFHWSVQTPCCCRKGLLQWCPGRTATERRNVRSEVKICSLVFDVVTRLIRALPWRTQETWLPGRSSEFSLRLEPQPRPSWSGYPTAERLQRCDRSYLTWLKISRGHSTVVFYLHCKYILNIEIKQESSLTFTGMSCPWWALWVVNTYEISECEVVCRHMAHFMALRRFPMLYCSTMIAMHSLQKQCPQVNTAHW